jgi:hypothetical protein
VWEKFGRCAESLAMRDPAGGVLLTPCPTTFRDIHKPWECNENAYSVTVVKRTIEPTGAPIQSDT